MTMTEVKERVCFLEGERVYLSPMRVEDFDQHYRWDHDRELVYLDDNYFRPKHYGKAKESFEKRIEADDMMPFVIVLKATGEVIGLMELYDVDNYERKCYWGIILEKPFWRQGIGTEVGTLMLKYVFEELGFRRLKAYTHSGNPGSMAFHEKLGFVREGVLRQEYFFGGEFVDGIDYAMLAEEYQAKYGG